MRRLPDWITSYLQLTDNSEPAELYRKWAAVSIVASCMQRKCWVPWGKVRKPVFPNLYIVLVGPPGARKGEAMGQALHFLYLPELNIQMATDSTSRANLIRDFSQSFQQHLMPDGMIIPHSSMSVISPEFTVFLGRNNVQMLDDLTDWYDSEKNPWIHKTLKSDAVKIIGPLLNILGATTPDMLKSSVPPEFISGGLAGRIIFLYAPRKEKTVVTEFETAEEMELGQVLENDLMDIITMGGQWAISPKALAFYEEWYESYVEEDECQDPRFAAYFTRKPTTLKKLSLILSGSRSEDKVISLHDIEHAFSMLIEAEQRMYYCLQGVGRNQYAPVMNKIMIEIARRGRIYQSELMYQFRDEVSKFELMRIMETLEMIKFCSVYSNTGEIMYNEGFNNGKH